MNKDEIVDKVSAGVPIATNDALSLLASKRIVHKEFGLRAVESQAMKELKDAVILLTEERNDIIASDAIECLLRIDKNNAKKVAVKHIGDRRKFVQASSLFVLSELQAKEYLERIRRVGNKHRKNSWRRLRFLGTLYALDGHRLEYLRDIFAILERTTNYHVQCSGINILKDRAIRRHFEVVESFMSSYRRRKALPESVKSSLRNAFREIRDTK